MSKHHKKHKVKTHHWVNGILHAVEHEFHNLEAAMQFLKFSNHHSAKVMDEDGQVVHSAGSVDTDTYA
jgi:hypothetical protein